MSWSTSSPPPGLYRFLRGPYSSSDGSKAIFGKYTYFLDPKIHGLLVFVSDLMCDFLLIEKSSHRILAQPGHCIKKHHFGKV